MLRVPFYFRFVFWHQDKSRRLFFFFASQGCGWADFVDRDEGTHHLLEIGDYRGERNKGVGVG